jgi:hypothetical protein
MEHTSSNACSYTSVEEKIRMRNEWMATMAALALPGVLIAVVVIQPLFEFILKIVLFGCAAQKRQQKPCEA